MDAPGEILTTLSKLVVEVKNRKKVEVCLASVTGASGISKSSVVTSLREMIEQMGLTTESIETDGFLYPPEVMREVLGLEPTVWNGFPGSYDYTALWYTAYCLKNGEQVWVPLYDHLRHRRAASMRVVTPKDVIFFEGLHPLEHTAHSKGSLRSLMDLTIYVGLIEGLGGEEFLLKSRLNRELRREREAQAKCGVSRTEDQLRRIYEVREARLYKEVVRWLRYKSHVALTIGPDYMPILMELRDPTEPRIIRTAEQFLSSIWP